MINDEFRKDKGRGERPTVKIHVGEMQVRLTVRVKRAGGGRGGGKGKNQEMRERVGK